MSGAIELTVVVLGYQGGEILSRCIASLEAQTGDPFDLQVVRSPEGAPDYPDAIASCLASVRTPWVMFLLDHSELAPHWMDAFADYVTDESVGAVGGPIRVFEGASTTAEWYDPEGAVSWFSFGVDRSHLADLPTRPAVAEVAFLSGRNMALRTRLALAGLHGRVGPLALDHDLEWSASAKDAGLRVVFDSRLEAAVYKEGRPTERERGAARTRGWDHGYLLAHARARHGAFWTRVSALAGLLMIGDRRSPGALALPVFMWRPYWRRRWSESMRGKAAGLLDAIRGR